MRGFWLRDENGVTVSLGGDGIAWDGPTGLGFTVQDGANHLGNGVFAEAGSRDETPDELAGDLVFTAGGTFEDGYSRYRDFVNWMMSAQELTLIYDPGGVLASGYHRRVVFASLGKGEVYGGGLRCPVVMRCMEPWYNPAAAAQTMTVSGTTLILNPAVGGHRPAGFYLEVTGGLQYPNVIVTNNGAEIGRCKINATFSTAQTLALDTRPDSCGVWRKDSDGTMTDMMQYVYLDYDPFPLLPLGLGSQIKVTTENTQIGAGSVTVYEYYRSV